MDTISIIGVGRLGLPFGLLLEKYGFKIIGMDKNQSYVDRLNDRTFESFEPYVEQYLKSAKNFTATTEMINILQSTVIFVLVNTKSLPDGRYDHSHIESIIEDIVSFGKQEMTRHFVILSTINPGYCDEIAKTLEPLNYTVSYNPELLAQGTIIQNLQNPEIIIIGENSVEAGNKIQEIYQKICQSEFKFYRMSRLSAEIAKMAFNCFSTTKISFANLIGDLAIKVGAEPEKILEAVGAHSKIGSKCFKYGFGYGGPCLPRDNKALSAFGKDHGIEFVISRATEDANQNHLNFQFGQYVKNFDKEKLIIFEGVTYKKGTNLIEESQQFALSVKLAKAGYKIKIKDSQTVINEIMKKYNSLFEYEVV